MKLHFACTTCGDCCRNFRLPLSMAEAWRWLAGGNAVEVLCEAIPWPQEPAPGDRGAAYKRERSFAARSGALPVRIAITLVAPLGAGCPYLQADQRCGNYAGRPLACRIYPAAAHPLRTPEPARRRCPEPAWSADGPVFWLAGGYADEPTRAAVAAQRTDSVADAMQHAALCEALGMRCAGIANEGYAVYRPERQQLLDALRSVRANTDADDVAPPAPADAMPMAIPIPQNWRCLSDQAQTLETLRQAKAQCAEPSAAPRGVHYLSWFTG